MLPNGTTVTCRDGANRKRTGQIDATSIASGDRLYRVNDRWFPRDVLTVN